MVDDGAGGVYSGTATNLPFSLNFGCVVAHVCSWGNLSFCRRYGAPRSWARGKGPLFGDKDFELLGIVRWLLVTVDGASFSPATPWMSTCWKTMALMFQVELLFFLFLFACLSVASVYDVFALCICYI
jgi:hypothetical protein